VGLSGGSHLSEENDQMDNSLRDLSLSPESLECHPPRIILKHQIINNVSSLILNETKYLKGGLTRNYSWLILIDLISNGYRPKLFLNFDKLILYDYTIN
jgi:hypothetical protein